MSWTHTCLYDAYAYSLAELDAIPNPKVVLTSQNGFSAGFGLELFMRWASNPRNLVIFTSGYHTIFKGGNQPYTSSHNLHVSLLFYFISLGRPDPGTLGRSLLDNPGRKQVEVRCYEIVHVVLSAIDFGGYLHIGPWLD